MGVRVKKISSDPLDGFFLLGRMRGFLGLPGFSGGLRGFWRGNIFLEMLDGG
jgi:hypothetical protein